MNILVHVFWNTCAHCLWGLYLGVELLVMEEAYGQFNPNSFQLAVLIYITNSSPGKIQLLDILIQSGCSGGCVSDIISLWF